MAFPTINVNTPVGTQRPGVLDDEIRQLKTDIINSLKQISGYPDTVSVKVPSWSTANRPTDPEDDLIGYNTDTGALERASDGSWTTLSLAVADSTRTNGIRITISATAPTDSLVANKELWLDITSVPVWKYWNGTAWVGAGAMYA